VGRQGRRERISSRLCRKMSPSSRPSRVRSQRK
jgi:hypothetical protein